MSLCHVVPRYDFYISSILLFYFKKVFSFKKKKQMFKFQIRIPCNRKIWEYSRVRMILLSNLNWTVRPLLINMKYFKCKVKICII
jgi:hypothetical protein